MAYTIAIGFIVIIISLLILGVKWSKEENKTQEAEANRRKEEEAAKRKAQEKAMEEEKVKIQEEQHRKFENEQSRDIEEFITAYGISPNDLKRKIENSTTAKIIAEKIDLLPKHPPYIELHNNYIFAPTGINEGSPFEKFSSEIQFKLYYCDLGLHELPWRDCDGIDFTDVLTKAVASHSKYYERYKYHSLRLSTQEQNENLFANW